MAFGGKLDYNPIANPIPSSSTSTESFTFQPPSGHTWPPNGYHRDLAHYSPPEDDSPSNDSGEEFGVDPESRRIQLIEPFKPWDGQGVQKLAVLIKVKGKCSEYKCWMMIRFG